MKIDDAFMYLRRGYDMDRMAQAYIIQGPIRGEGGRLVDMVLQLVFCSSDDRPCDTCKSCRQAAAHTHPDLLWVEPQKKSRAISIEQIRELQRRVYQTSYLSGWKVCVIVGADRMGNEAANAFLKTLEEPPGRSLFLLLTDSPQSLLPTIISRCQRIAISGSDIVLREDWMISLLDILSGEDKAADTSRTVAAFSRADRLVTLLKEIKKDAVDEEARLAEEEVIDEDDDTVDARANARYRENRSQVMLAMLLWYRDILMVVSGADETCVHYVEKVDIVLSKAKKVSYRQAMRNIRVVESMSRQMDRNLPDSPVCSFGFSRLSC